MIFLSHLLTIIIPLIYIGLLELLMVFPTWLIGIACSLFVMIVFVVWQLHQRKMNREFIGFFIPPFLVTQGSLFLLVFIDQSFVRHGLVLLVGLLMAIFLRSLFSYILLPRTYQPYSLENTSSYLNLLSFFFFATGFFTLSIFLKTNIFLLLALSFGITLLVTSQTFWIHKIGFQRGKIFIVSLGILMTELFWVINYLPSSHLVNGMLMTLLYYVLINLGRYHYLNKLQPGTVRRYLATGSVLILIILLTAQWF